MRLIEILRRVPKIFLNLYIVCDRSLLKSLKFLVDDFDVCKEAVELKTNLELRKIFLEGLQANGQADAVVQKEIEIIQSRIDNCAEQIRKEEEKVGM